jgi:hypothetical protein
MAVEVDEYMNKTRFINLWSMSVGAMDSLTGILLVFFPLLVLDLLGIAPPSGGGLVFVQWIGIFVMGVGLSYGLSFGRRSRGETVWVFTALIRSLVAVFLLVNIMTDSLVPAWGLVGICDAVVAIVQIVILRLGWWKGIAK